MKEKIGNAIISVIGAIVIAIIAIAIFVQFIPPADGGDIIYGDFLASFFGGGFAVLFFLCFLYIFSHIEE